MDDVKKKIELINNELYWSPESKIENIGELYYIKEYENTTVSILDSLIKLSEDGIVGYSEFTENMINKYHINIDSAEKKNVLLHLFENTKGACIYGPAGTGKSFLARLISDIYKDYKKVYISNTNTAVNNLYKKVGGDIQDFMTIKKYLNNIPSSYLLFIWT